MRNIILSSILVFFVFGCIAKENKPYEATWMELTKVGDSYVVYNYPSLWDDGETKSPAMIKIHGNQLTRVIFSDSVLTFSYDNAEKRDNDVYFFRVGNYYSFHWFDKDKHIAKWNIYYGEENRIMSDYLYIDSLHNTFPIVDYEWEDMSGWDADCDCYKNSEE